ncbi:MAG: alpha/beta hydrolase [Hyphomicrobiaceae bacterium]|nr:alpha/beta hydrolase [Hyphomicrobiaceae bacterium]
MLARILLLLAILGAATEFANGQSAPKPALGPCATKAGQALPALEKHKEVLKRRLALARAARRNPSAASTDEAKKQEAIAKTQEISKTQAALLDVLVRIHCLKLQEDAESAEPPPPEPPAPPEIARAEPAPASAAPSVAVAPKGAPKTRGARRLPADVDKKMVDTAGLPPPAPATPRGVTGQADGPGGAIEVVTYYATNRGRSGSREPAKVYGTNAAPLTYGRALVSIPATHTSGRLELPSIWRLQLQPDPKKHFVLKSVTSLKTDEARWQMAKALEGSGSKAILLFVHGYNMSFAETAMRTAQLAYDLDFPGVPFFFSWPSIGQMTGYLHDGETAELSQDAFNQVLDDLSALPAGEMYIIAHSMGSRIVSEVLRARVERGKPNTRISELLLAAPDINAEIFRTRIAPRLAEMQGTQTTVYASSSDLALIASKTVNGYQRVGETAGGVFVYPGLETIDASKAALVMRDFGHSYLTDSAAVLRDIGSLLRLKLSAKARGLSQTGISPDIYWSLR